MSAREASMYHMEKLEITEDLEDLADHSLNPPMRNCDQLNMSVTPLLCCSPADALPVAMAFTSSQDEETYTTGKFL